MKEVKHKYQVEYENTPGCFWKPEPAKYVKLLANKLGHNLANFKVLDLGAGEGKNSVYLAGLGATVFAVDISSIALSKFSLQPNYEESRSRISVAQLNIESLEFAQNEFDIIVAYGILHCLPSKQEIISMVQKIKSWTKNNGYFVCATFTNEIPPPVFQDYLEIESFLDKGELETFFSDWNIINSENDLIRESHPTTIIEHEHSITRLIAKKNE